MNYLAPHQPRGVKAEGNQEVAASRCSAELGMPAVGNAKQSGGLVPGSCVIKLGGQRA